jgi:glycosyltransferase involved in cell wall biosynthesis
MFDQSKKLFNRKKELFSGLDLTIVTPSQWLADMVKQSYFKDYPVQVIYNGIDLDVFKPSTTNAFREKNGLLDKKIILGVAFVWDARKGLDVFVELDKRLPDDYKIVLVGTNDGTDKRLPESIISIHRTQNQQELAEIYSCADVFVNPTREEVLGLTNIEALACGTPVITFKTGGSPETIDSNSGSVVECDDIDALEREIIRICEDNPYSKENCIAKAQDFAKSKRFQEYVDLYERVLNP